MTLMQRSQLPPSNVLMFLRRTRILATVQPEIEPVDRPLLRRPDLTRILQVVGAALDVGNDVELHRSLQDTQSIEHLPRRKDMRQAARFDLHSKRRSDSVRIESRRTLQPDLEAFAISGRAVDFAV